MAARLRSSSRTVSALRLSGLVTGAMTAFIGFGPTAHAETVPTADQIAAATAIINGLGTGSSGSSGSSGSAGSSEVGAQPALPAPVSGQVQPSPPTALAPPVPAAAPALPVAPAPPTPSVPQYAVPANGVMTSGFGDGRGHQGIDLAGPIGDPIYAASGGKVINAGPADGFGLWVRIQHPDGTITTYGHNNANLVAVGDTVTAGQQIATIGNRGDSTGPHLHFEVKLPDGTNTDPQDWLHGHGIDVQTNKPAEETPEVPAETDASGAGTPDPTTPDETPTEAPADQTPETVNSDPKVLA